MTAVGSGHFGGFTMAVGFETGRAVVDVGGEIDLQTAPTLGALLRALVDQGHQPLVLDFAGLKFMDASGLRVIVDIAVGLARSADELTVRSVPAQTQRILDITGVSDLLRIEAPSTDLVVLGPEERVGDASAPVGAIDESLPADLASVRVMRSDTDVLDAALRLVAALAAVTVEGADGDSKTDGAFGSDQQELAALFARQASGILAGSNGDVSDQDVSTWISNALAAREVIAQAQGVHMARQSISAKDAAAAIHRSAREREVSVLVESTDVVGSTQMAIPSRVADRSHV